MFRQGHILLLLSISSLTIAFECNGLEGPVADPEDCQSFYLCAFEQYEHFNCEFDYLFDDTLKVCNYWYNVDCGSRPNPMTTAPMPTTTPSTTPSCDTSPWVTTTTTAPHTTTPMDTTTPYTTPGTPTTTLETTTSAFQPSTTTTSSDYNLRFPDKVVALYILLADDTEDGFHTEDEWQPKLHPWQQEGANVLFFTFINPETMSVPKSFAKLALSRGTDQEGAVPKDTVIIFAIGGILYSQNYNPWHWLTSKEAAENMAIEVATWPDRYGCDGIDLDIEEGAGDAANAGENMVHFVKKLRSLRPNIIIGQPTYGYPAVHAANDIINNSWDTNGNYLNVGDSVGIMVYEGTQSLNYVKNFIHGAEQWEGFPIKVNVNPKAVMLGCKGWSSSNVIMELAQEAVKQDLLGIMVWYASVINGFQYEGSWDASSNGNSQNGYIEALKYFNNL